MADTLFQRADALYQAQQAEQESRRRHYEALHQVEDEKRAHRANHEHYVNEHERWMQQQYFVRDLDQALSSEFQAAFQLSILYGDDLPAYIRKALIESRVHVDERARAQRDWYAVSTFLDHTWVFFHGSTYWEVIVFAEERYRWTHSHLTHEQLEADILRAVGMIRTEQRSNQ